MQKKSSQLAENSSQYAMPVRTKNLVTSSQIVDCFQSPVMRSCTEGWLSVRLLPIKNLIHFIF